MWDVWLVFGVCGWCVDLSFEVLLCFVLAGGDVYLVEVDRDAQLSGREQSTISARRAAGPVDVNVDHGEEKERGKSSRK